LLVAGSLVALAVTLAAIARSYFVMDRVHWTAATAEPLTARAETFAKRRGIVPRYVAHQRSWSVGLMRGRIVVTQYETREPMGDGDETFKGQFLDRTIWGHDHNPPRAEQDWWQAGFFGRLGFGYLERASATRLLAVYRRVTVPLWTVALLTAVTPGVGLMRIARVRRRRRHGRCLACGYDLRGNPDGRRCPECGMIPEEAMPDYIRPRAPAVPAAR
jgi:hypothetical protein